MSALPRVVSLAAVWVLLAGTAPSSLVVGAFVVAVAVAWSRILPPPGSAWRLRPLRLLAFAPYFLWHSLRGGADVAVRALRPSMPLSPRFEAYPVRLPQGPPRVFFMNVVSLLPGTLSGGFDGDELTVHVIGGPRSARDRLRALEERVARLFASPGGSPPEVEARR